jgi:hypothetical protein
LQERAIAPTSLVPGVRVGGVDDLVDAVLADSSKVLWV